MWKKIKRKLADLIRSASFTEVGVALDYSANWQTRGVLVALKRVLADLGVGGTAGAVLSMAVFVVSGACVYFGIMAVGDRATLRGLVDDFRGRRAMFVSRS